VTKNTAIVGTAQTLKPVLWLICSLVQAHCVIKNDLFVRFNIPHGNQEYLPFDSGVWSATVIEKVGVFRFGMVSAQAVNDKIIIDLYSKIADLFTTVSDPAAEKRQLFTFKQ
jgi:hypothetical protein